MTDYPITNTFHLASSAEGDNAQVIYPGACMVYSSDCYNTGPAGLRLALFNQNTVPEDTDDPVWIIYLAGQDSSPKEWPNGLYFPNGLAMDIMAEQPGVLVPGVIEALNIGFRAL